MKIMRKEKIDVKKFMEEVKANRTNRSYTSIEPTYPRDDRSQKPKRLGSLYSSVNAQNFNERGKSIPPPITNVERSINFPQNYSHQPNYPLPYQYQAHSSQFYQPSQSFVSTPPMLYNPHSMMNYSQTYQQSQVPPIYNMMNEVRSPSFEQNFYEGSAISASYGKNRFEKNNFYEDNSNMKEDTNFQTANRGSLKQIPFQNKFDLTDGSKKIQILASIQTQNRPSSLQKNENKILEIFQVKQNQQKEIIEKTQELQAIKKKKGGKRGKKKTIKQQNKVQLFEQPQVKVFESIVNNFYQGQKNTQKIEETIDKFESFLNNQYQILIKKYYVRQKGIKEKQFNEKLSKIVFYNNIILTDQIKQIRKLNQRLKIKENKDNNLKTIIQI